MKRIVKILGAAAFCLILYFNLSISAKYNTNNSKLSLSSIVRTLNANAEDPCPVGSGTFHCIWSGWACISSTECTSICYICD